MALTRGFIRNAVTTPLDARLMDMAQVVGNSDRSPRTGVLDGYGRTIVTTTGTMNVAVAAADFAVSKSTGDGVAIFTNDGSVNVAIGAAPASNSRIDVIWVRHNDDTTGDADSLPVFGVTAGAAAATPTVPAIPTGALELAQLRIYSGTVATNGGSNTITNTYRMTTSRGGIVPFRTRSELVAWTNPMSGQSATVLDATDGGEYRYNGTAWKRVGGKLIGCKVRRAAPQSIPNSAFTAIAGDTEVFDSGNMWTVGAPTRLVAPVAGVYQLNASIGINLGITGRITVQFLKNGATVEYGGTLIPTVSIAEVTGSVGTLANLAAGDYIECQIRQESGSAQDTGVGGYSQPVMSMSWVGEV